MIKKTFLAELISTGIFALFASVAGIESRAENDPRLYAVEVSANVLVAPPQVQLTWPADANATSYSVSRKLPTATSWTSLGSLTGNTTSFADGNVTVGSAWEYRLTKSTPSYTGYGYILAGINAPFVENRGKVVLLVDATHAAALASELARLQQDLAGDGWTVLRRDVARTATSPQVKDIIKTDYNADPTNVKAVFIFGHVAVPRSGDIYPDGHPDHRGAWTADLYYGEMNGAWTDSTVNYMTSEKSANHNAPGDGKFDQSVLPSDLELAVGRVDFHNMTCFANKTPSRSELDLLRQYLNKDHNFRQGRLNIARRGLVMDQFGESGGEAFAATGWRSFAPMFGAANNIKVEHSQYFPTLTANSYLFAYATGGGGYTTCNGVGGSDDFATKNVQSVFNVLFGSYFGDFDNESNFLRSILGSGSALTVSWSGRPHWYYHQMALGGTVGSSAVLSQNNTSLYERQNMSARSVNNNLLGDPTLRLHPVVPASNVIVSGASLTWAGSTDTAIQGYHVYRSTNADGPFTRLTATPVGTPAFTDAAPVANAIYMVRAIKLETTPSGTYYNLSQGAFYPSVPVTTTNTPPVVTPPSTNTPPGVTNPPPSTNIVSTNIVITNIASSVKFVKADTTTSGNWKSVYGAEGFWIQDINPALPSYATVTSTGASTWFWAQNYAGDTVSPLTPDSTSRHAACWYGNSAFSFDVNINDTKAHRVSAYFMDWDGSGRQQRVEIVDATTGAILHTQTLTNFSKGVYLTWEIAGKARMRVTPIIGNAVVSAFYFDAAPVTAPVTTPVVAAKYVRLDQSTKGNWKNLYGADGSILALDTPRVAPYAAVTWTGASQRTWTTNSTNSTDARLLWKNSSASERNGQTFHNNPAVSPMIFDIKVTDTNTHQLAIYVLDYDRQGRRVKLELLDGVTGALLDTRLLSNYAEGIYVVWHIKGPVKVQVTRIAGPDAAVGGIFLGTAGASL